MYTLSCPARFVSSSRLKFASGSEAKAGVPVNSGGVFKSVLAAMSIASYRELMTVTLRRQRGNEWQVVLFNLTCCQMESTQVEYTLCCIVLGEKVSFPVKIKKNQLVGELKEEIQKKMQMLASFDALHLNLYPLNMVVSDIDYPKVKRAITEKKFECKETEELQPEFELSVYFGDTNPPKTGAVHIVVVPPQTTIHVPGLQASPEMPTYSDKAMVQTRINDFINILRPKIREFLSKPRMPTWLPPESVDDETRRFYENLRVPVVNGRPSLLLHDLGVAPNSNTNNLFQGRKHRILCNTSGAGKTRLLLEGLSHRWGFYFVVAQGPDRIGARDLEAVIAVMSQSFGWTADVFNLNSTNILNANAGNRNQNIAINKISKAILARWIVFKTFMEVAEELEVDPLQDNIKLDWLLFQVLPSVRINYKDPFLALISPALDSVQSDVLQSLRDEFSPKSVLGSSFDATTDSFFYVIDEAQVAGGQHMGAFSDQAGAEKRPVLRPIIQQMVAEEQIGVRVIISGTGFSLELFKTLMASGVGKLAAIEFDVVHTTGDFSEPGTQSLYVSHYLPPPFLASDSGTRLMTRVYDWLRGRHRFTVSFLEELMSGPWHKDHPASPHKLLDAYVQKLTDFTPLDGNDMTLREAAVGPIEADTFLWDKIEKRPGLLEDLAYSIYSFIMRGDPPMWWSEQESLVEYGVARFVHEGEKSRVAVEEPLALISIMRYFERNSRTLEGHVRRCLQDAQGMALEEAVLLALTRLLQNQRSLSSIFNFYGESPSWASQSAQIVARNSSSNFEAFAIDGPRAIASRFAFTAKDPEDVQCWLESGQAAWCIPGFKMGPDVMARLRLDDGALLLLVIQAKCRTTGNTNSMYPGVSADAIRSLIPHRFYHSLPTAYTVNKTRRRAVKRSIKSMLGAINQGEESLGHKYNILRVVAAFPLDVNFQSSSKVVQMALDEDEHPLAALSHAILTAELATCPDGKSFVDQLKGKLKRDRAEIDEGSDDEAKDDRPKAKRGRGRTRRV